MRLAVDCPGVPCVDRHARVHVVFSLPGGLFCQACGAYSFRRTVKLHGSCAGRPSTATVARRRDRLMLGFHPLSGAFLGAPVRVGNPAESWVVELG